MHASTSTRWETVGQGATGKPSSLPASGVAGEAVTRARQRVCRCPANDYQRVHRCVDVASGVLCHPTHETRTCGGSNLQRGLAMLDLSPRGWSLHGLCVRSAGG
jgi:hypothetical protein